jgi:hypothetical protein
MIGKIVNNKIVQPPINDGNKFNVHLDAEWLEANGFYELTQAEIDTANEAAEVARQAAKAPALKQAENEYFALIDKININEGMTIAYSDNSAAIMQKAESAGLSMTKKSYYGMLLQNAIREVELKGGSWYGLPEQPHNQEE